MHVQFTDLERSCGEARWMWGLRCNLLGEGRRRREGVCHPAAAAASSQMNHTHFSSALLSLRLSSSPNATARVRWKVFVLPLKYFSRKLQEAQWSLALRIVKPSLLAFICAASISTAAVLSSGVRLSLSQPYALYVGQCSCSRHHTSC